MSTKVLIHWLCIAKEDAGYALARASFAKSDDEYNGWRKRYLRLCRQAGSLHRHILRRI